MALQTRDGGTGAPLVLLHGWAMNSMVWEPVRSALESDYRVQRLDLPGHGVNADAVPGSGAEGWIEAIAAAAPERAVWLGWSLGGMLALAVAARYPERVARLMLVATSPRFVEAPDWPEAVKQPVWDSFVKTFRNSPEKAVQRFNRLQGLGSEAPRVQSRLLQRFREDGGPPSPAGLTTGLDLLETLDVRQALASLDCPVHSILGGGDALVPESVDGALTELNPNIVVSVIASAGHAPFVSRPDAFLEIFRRAAAV